MLAYFICYNVCMFELFDYTFIKLLFFGLFGAIVGSFLNVYILRLNTGKDTGGRSACATCGKSLESYELVPILSFLFLRGRCSTCQTRISLQYPMVEFSTAIFFMILAIKIQSLILLPFVLFLFALNMIIVIYDIRHHIIPQKLINATAVTVILMFTIERVIKHDYLFASTFVSAVLAVIIFTLPLYMIYTISKGKAMGFGDVKLSAALFWLLSPWDSFHAFSLAFVLGAVSGLFMIFLSKFFKLKPLDIKGEIAFGPFIVLSFWLTYLHMFSLYDIIQSI